MQWETAKTSCHTRIHDKERCSPPLPRVFDTLSQFEACICKKYSFFSSSPCFSNCCWYPTTWFLPENKISSDHWSLHHASTPHGEDNNTKRPRAFGGLRGRFVEKYLHLFTLMTYLQYIQELLYNYASAEALRVVKEQKKHQNSRGNKWQPRLCNMRSPKKILVTLLPHTRMSRKLLRQKINA